jgi:hypothetical protein
MNHNKSYKEIVKLLRPPDDRVLDEALETITEREVIKSNLIFF